MMAHDATKVTIDADEFARSMNFTISNDTVYVSTSGTISYDGYLFTISDVNVTIVLYVNSTELPPVAKQERTFTLEPHDSETLSFNISVPRSYYEHAERWYIQVIVSGAMTYMDYNFASFSLIYTKEVS
ncbi:MAG: hypothetical protein ACTSSP_10950 [Candidatus Asgardarchaeia archaeon]